MGSVINLSALAEGPFTLRDGLPLETILTIPRERLQPGPTGARIGLRLSSDRGGPKNLVTLTTDSQGWRTRNQTVPADLEQLLSARTFLAQHVYAVASATLAMFEAALGRRIGWQFGPRLMVSIFDAIDYPDTGYDRDTGIVRFGHVRDGRTRHSVPLALYQDLVVHEITHAVVDGYRPRWADRSASVDQLALHEGLADLVAILSVFGSPERVEQQLVAAPRANLAQGGDDVRAEMLSSGLFGVADGLFSRGAARRPLTDQLATDWRQEPEPHRRGEALVRAELDALLRLWNARLPDAGSPVSRRQVAQTGSSVGTQLRQMLIRGLAYMPPVDPSWEDLLRGVLAADQVMVPSDVHGYRDAIRTAFASIEVTARSEADLTGLDELPGLSYPVRVSTLSSDPEEVYRFIWENPALIKAAKLDADSPITVDRVRPSVRISPDGFIVQEIGASFSQRVRLSRRAARDLLDLHVATDSVDIRGGGLLRFDEGGHLTFLALKPVLDAERQQAQYAALISQAPISPQPSTRPRTFHPAPPN